MGDFNFYRYAENRNKTGGNFHDTLVFNNIISNLGHVELPIKGRSYTWSNMQEVPLLQQIDWFFTFVAWTSIFPLSLVLPLARITSDHLPYRVQIGTNVPKKNIFRFENYWFNHPGCIEQIESVWNSHHNSGNSAHIVSAKFKNLRRILKHWSKGISNLSKLIANCNMTIAFLDKLEELRPLYPQEFNFRKIIKVHITSLLRTQNQYWRQRFTQRMTQFGDGNTIFFYSMATETFRKNVISQIMDDTGRMVSSHEEKSALFWNEFRRRLGLSVHTDMQFDLHTIVKRHDNLEDLCRRFTTEEIDNVIFDLPSDKAPGPDGFNNSFIKKCWTIIRCDMYKLCFDFFHHWADLKSINHSYITLVPKKDNPKKVNDFRPISLLNSSIKMVTKLLANKLQALAIDIIHEINMVLLKGEQFKTALVGLSNTYINAITQEGKLSFSS
jgi:hypothetical protein